MPKKKKRYPAPTANDIANVNALIKKHGSQAAVAEKTGISSYILTKIRKKKGVRKATLEVIKKAVTQRKKRDTPLSRVAARKEQVKAPRTFVEVLNGDHEGLKRIEAKLDRVIKYFDL